MVSFSWNGVELTPSSNWQTQRRIRAVGSSFNGLKSYENRHRRGLCRLREATRIVITQKELEAKGYRFVFGKRAWVVSWGRDKLFIASGTIDRFYNSHARARKEAIGAAAQHMVLKRTERPLPLMVNGSTIFGVSRMSAQEWLAVIHNAYTPGKVIKLKDIKQFTWLRKNSSTP